MAFNLAWFSTGRDEAARELLQVVVDSIAGGTTPARLRYVFSNRESGEAEESDMFFELVRNLGIKLICFSSSNFGTALRRKGRTDSEAMKEWRLKYDREVMSRISRYPSDLIVLAGYMLIVGKEMCTQYNLINLHPAAPAGPAGTWQEVIWKLIESRADETGVMMHLVTEELDKGPPITYCTFPIRGPEFDPLWEVIELELKSKSLSQLNEEAGEGNRLFRAIRREGVRRELPLIIHTLKVFAEGKIKIENKKLVDEKGAPIKEFCLTEQINSHLSI
jgi:phosphoribosylglycinamide formyltransferase-1